MRIDAHARSDVGQVRAGNEDEFYVGETVFAVADGMGGHVAGEIAARTALEPIAALDGRTFDDDDAAEEALVEALRQANREVVDKAEAEPSYKGMGTTLTAALHREDQLHVAHVGDSRAYLLRDDEAISQLTTDHTLVERLVREGRLSRDEAESHPQRNVITRAIGNEPDVIVDVLPPLRLHPGDQVLLCSDGLTGPVADAEIAHLLQEVDDPEYAVTSLVDRANAAGGPDNITVVLLRADGHGDEEDVFAAHASGGLGARTREVRQISTRDAGSDDWAATMSRFGAPQGAGRRATGDPEKPYRAGGKRVLAGVVAAVLLIALVGGGGWLLLDAAYFVGDNDGEVAIFQGIPGEVAGVPLHRVVDDDEADAESLPVDALPEYRRSELEEGITARDLADARAILESLAAERLDEDDEADEEDDADDETEVPDEDDDADDEGAGALGDAETVTPGALGALLAAAPRSSV